jgi:hypothetical protein
VEVVQRTLPLLFTIHEKNSIISPHLIYGTIFYRIHVKNPDHNKTLSKTPKKKWARFSKMDIYKCPKRDSWT